MPRIPYEEGFHRLVVRIDQIGLKDAHVYLNPFFTVSVKGNWKKKKIVRSCALLLAKTIQQQQIYFCVYCANFNLRDFEMRIHKSYTIE